MTKKERAQVVELLRCAAYLHVVDPTAGIVRACRELNRDHLFKRAFEARATAKSEGPTEYLHTLLEAAARVEEGSWP